ncbi:MAG: long-chain-fatty-acid--CoA ligase [Acidobacteria bacterium]|nr:long-chain-fatty-acid--CoA ligase [Acidobacteriota bacterium]
MILPLTPIRFLERAHRLYGNKVGVICGSERFTYNDFFDRCCRLAGALRGLGLQPQDRVAFLSYNCHRLLEAYYGVLQAGGVLLPLNIRLAPQEIAFILRDSAARFLFLDQDFLPLAQAIRKDAPHVKNYFLLGKNAPASEWLDPRAYDPLLAESSPAAFDFMAIDENSIAELFYTSGTTADPKGVMLSHRTVYLHALNVLAAQQMTDTTVELHTIPLFHANGWGAAHTVMAVGGTHVMVKKFDPAQICQLVQQEKVTFFSMVPTMATALLHYPDLPRYDLRSLEWVMIGGAASSEDLIRQLEERLGCKAYAGYGLTETSPVLTIAHLSDALQNASREEQLHRQAMTGRPIVGVELRVVDEQGRDVPKDRCTLGEIVARSDGVMDGYWQRPQETQACFRDGWLLTGDMAVWDEQGYVLIMDRKKDIIISGGENISSVEIEKALCAHPSVYECAVIPVPDEQWGEVPKALVALKESATVSGEELLAFLKERLANFKVPKSIEILPFLPKGGTGKILKKELREKYWTGQAKRVH